MPIAKTSKQRRPSSKPQSQRTNRSRTTKLCDELVKGLKRAAAHFRGEVKLPSYEYHIPERIDVRAVRERIGLSQAQFAVLYALNPRTVQEWEQGRAEPDLAVRAYLTVIDRNPRAVRKALAAAAMKP
jgi:putative transcriptional regulator